MYAQVARGNPVQIMSNTSSTYHVQQVMHHVERKDSSAIKFDRVEVAFILLFHLLQQLTNEMQYRQTNLCCSQKVVSWGEKKRSAKIQLQRQASWLHRSED